MIGKLAKMPQLMHWLSDWHSPLRPPVSIPALKKYNYGLQMIVSSMGMCPCYMCICKPHPEYKGYSVKFILYVALCHCFQIAANYKTRYNSYFVFFQMSMKTNENLIQFCISQLDPLGHLTLL